MMFLLKTAEAPVSLKLQLQTALNALYQTAFLNFKLLFVMSVSADIPNMVISSTHSGLNAEHLLFAVCDNLT